MIAQLIIPKSGQKSVDLEMHRTFLGFYSMAPPTPKHTIRHVDPMGFDR